MSEHAEGWLIVKRDLYYRPESKGYTGIRDEAGRFPYAIAKDCQTHGCSIVHESEAPEFREATYDDLIIKHLIKQRDEARAALTAALGDAVAWMVEWDEGGEHVRQFYKDEDTANLVKWNVRSYKVGVADPAKVTPLYAPSVTRHGGDTP